MSAKTVSEEAAHTVSTRQWIRLVVVYLLIPLILYICGGDLCWWQAWLYSMMLLVAGIGRRLMAFDPFSKKFSKLIHYFGTKRTKDNPHYLFWRLRNYGSIWGFPRI